MIVRLRIYLCRLALCVALYAATVGSASVGRAGQSVPVSGDFMVTSSMPVAIEDVGSHCVIELDATFAFIGSLEGAFEAQFTILHFGACDELAYELFWATGTYTGSVLGQEGSFDFVFFGQITEVGYATGQLIVTNGSGGLEDLRGRVMLSGLAGVGGSYAGRVR